MDLRTSLYYFYTKIQWKWLSMMASDTGKAMKVDTCMIQPHTLELIHPFQPKWSHLVLLKIRKELNGIMTYYSAVLRKADAVLREAKEKLRNGCATSSLYLEPVHQFSTELSNTTVHITVFPKYILSPLCMCQMLVLQFTTIAQNVPTLKKCHQVAEYPDQAAHLGDATKSGTFKFKGH
jgi:hypothetical protein